MRTISDRLNAAEKCVATLRPESLVWEAFESKENTTPAGPLQNQK